MKRTRLAFFTAALVLALAAASPAFAAEDAAPDWVLTRGEFVSGLFELSGADASAGSFFDDVPAGDPLEAAVC